MAKTPSPRVIAAKWFLKQMDADGNSEELEAHNLSLLCGSRVSDQKAVKVREQLDKLSKKFHERMQKIVDKFNSPPEKKPKGKASAGK